MLSFAIWSMYNAAALRDLDGLSVHICSYEQVAAEPLASFHLMAASLGEWGESVDGAKIDAASASIDPTLGRATWPRSRSAEFDAPQEITELYRQLESKDGAHQSFTESIIDLPRWVPALLDERRHTIELERRYTAVSQAPNPTSRSQRLAELAKSLRKA